MTAIVTIVSSHLADVFILYFMGGGLQYALTFWGAWTLVVGIIAFAIALPVIVALEKANVRKIKGDKD
jgi:TRAP-type C4-dicarboxylate transport system permease small subunit